MTMPNGLHLSPCPGCSDPRQPHITATKEADVRATPTMSPETPKAAEVSSIGSDAEVGRGRLESHGREDGGRHLEAVSEAQEGPADERGSTSPTADCGNPPPEEHTPSPVAASIAQTPDVKRSRSEAWTPERREVMSRRMRENHVKGVVKSVPMPERPHEEAPAVSKALPGCGCPPGWAISPADRLTTSSHHHGECPRHKHRHRFGTTPIVGGAFVGRCECGHEETRNPYAGEDNRGPTAKAAAHRAAVAG